jgi:hypothetical protein
VRLIPWTLRCGSKHALYTSSKQRASKLVIKRAMQNYSNTTTVSVASLSQVFLPYQSAVLSNSASQLCMMSDAPDHKPTSVS